MSWASEDLASLRRLWASGQSAAQIARRLGYSRNAVCAKLTRLGLKRGRKPPTAKPVIVSVPKRMTMTSAACSRLQETVVYSRKSAPSQPREFSKPTLYAMLAEAVRNTGKSRSDTVRTRPNSRSRSRLSKRT